MPLHRIHQGIERGRDLLALAGIDVLELLGGLDGDRWVVVMVLFLGGC